MNEDPLFDWQQEHMHRDPLKGEREAAAKAEGQAPSIKRKILSCLMSRGEEGMTPDEFCDLTGTLINTGRRRFTDLWKEGHIKHHPEEKHRQNSAGNDCIVWVLGCDPAGEATRVESLKDQIKRLRQEVADLRLQLNQKTK